jgi:hypothetical protein
MFQAQGKNLPGTRANTPLVDGAISCTKYPSTITPAITLDNLVKSVKNFILMK